MSVYVISIAYHKKKSFDSVKSKSWKIWYTSWHQLHTTISLKSDIYLVIFYILYVDKFMHQKWQIEHRSSGLGFHCLSCPHASSIWMLSTFIPLSDTYCYFFCVEVVNRSAVQREIPQCTNRVCSDTVMFVLFPGKLMCKRRTGSCEDCSVASSEYSCVYSRPEWTQELF